MLFHAGQANINTVRNTIKLSRSVRGVASRVLFTEVLECLMSTDTEYSSFQFLATFYK